MADEKIIFSMVGVSKTFTNQKKVLNNIYLSFFYGAKIGIIGLNGSGKSTLMKIIAGIDKNYQGEVVFAPGYTVGYLEQEPKLDDTKTVKEVVEEGCAATVALLKEYEEINTKLCEPMSDDEMNRLIERQGELYEQIDHVNGWELDSVLERAMDALRCPDPDQSVKVLSGGERRRVALCRLLLQQPDVLLLDEPTNHLDAESIDWLEQHLRQYKGTVIAVTHDRYFFDRVVNRTLEIDGGEGYLYTGNYSLFLQKREERRIAAAGAAQRLRNVYRRELAWISRGAEARRTKSKERIERFNALKEEVNNIKKEAQLEISSVGSRLGRTIIELEGIGLDYGGKTYINDFSYIILRNDRIGIVGPNGSGKSSLMDIIAGRLAPTRGTLKVGQTVKIGYFAQHSEFKDADCRVLEYIKNVSDYIETADGTRITAAQTLFVPSGAAMGARQQIKRRRKTPFVPVKRFDERAQRADFGRTDQRP